MRVGYIRGAGRVRKTKRRREVHHINLIKRKLSLIKQKFTNKVVQETVPETRWKDIMTSGKINPLQNDVVLQVLFKKLQIEDLNKCRLVCSQWNSRICEILKKSWQDLKIINLEEKCDVAYLKEKMYKSPNKEIIPGFRTTLKTCIVDLKREYFEEYQPKLLALHMECWGHLYKGPDLYDLSTVLWYSANYLRELRLNYDTSPEKDVNFEQLINFAFPLLEKIKFELPTFQCETEASIKNILQVLQVICTKSPKLKSIYFKRASLFQSILFDIIKEDRVWKNIQEFGIEFDRGEREEEILGEEIPIGISNLLDLKKNGVKLKILTLKFTQSIFMRPLNIDNIYKILSKFLQGQSQTLEDLTVQLGVESYPIENDRFKIILPNFVKLKKLTLGKCGLKYFNHRNYLKYIPFASIDVKDKFPVLKEIDLKFGGDTDWAGLFTGTLETVTTIRVESLKLGGGVLEKIIVNNYHSLEKIFPNVKIFQVNELDCIIDCQGKNPWENTLEILIITGIFSSEIVNFDFGIFEHFKALQRLELFQYLYSSSYSSQNQVLWINFNLESFYKLNLKSFKMHSFQLSEYTVGRIHQKCVFDYKPYRHKPQEVYEPESDLAESESESDSVSNPSP